MGYDVIPVAWTGIAAMLLAGGRTVHSRFKLPLILRDTSISSLKVNSKKASTIRKSKHIIWDEAPMASAYALMVVNRLLNGYNGKRCFLWWKVIVLVGDFR